MTNFEVTSLTVYEKDKLRGFATVKVAGVFFVNGLRIIEGAKGLFVAMPSRKNSGGEYEDIAFPASKAIREELQTLVLKEYFAKAGGD